MKYSISFLALILCLGLSSCQTLGRMGQAVGRSTGLVSHEGGSMTNDVADASAPEFD